MVNEPFLDTVVNCSFPFFHEEKFIFGSTLGEKAFRSCPSHCTPDGKTNVFPIMKDEARSLILVGVIILVGLIAFLVLKVARRISNPCSTVACSTPKGGALHSERHTFSVLNSDQRTYARFMSNECTHLVTFR